MSDQPTNPEVPEPYEPPVAEDLATSDSPATTAAGFTGQAPPP